MMFAFQFHCDCLDPLLAEEETQQALTNPDRMTDSGLLPTESDEYPELLKLI